MCNQDTTPLSDNVCLPSWNQRRPNSFSSQSSLHLEFWLFNFQGCPFTLFPLFGAFFVLMASPIFFLLRVKITILRSHGAFWHEHQHCSWSPFRPSTGNNVSEPLFSPFFSSTSPSSSSLSQTFLIERLLRLKKTFFKSWWERPKT